MISHYNAFISYKHADVDSRVAEMVQKDLENFHIPHKLAKKLGINRIDRIFRDKTELPATNDLSEEITYALNNSDFLIVICSPRVKQSVWVQREIEMFLRTHSKKSVLTVIAEGDPTEVIPDILLYDDMTVMQPNGVYSTLRVTIEPLSCDYRGKRRIVKRDELPRLASCIIGCSYDELMRRRRKHEIHRVIAIASIVGAAFLAFGLYMLYSKTIINRNYTNALANRSRYLATQSEKCLDDEDRIEALFLALAALPKDDNSDIPVTPEAERALVDASLAYQSLDGQHLNALRNYRLSGDIRDFKLSPDGRYLVAYDEYCNVGLWDTLTGSKNIDIANSIHNVTSMNFIDDDYFILTAYNGVYCYETKTGNQVWKNEDESITYTTKVTLNGSSLYFLSQNIVTVLNAKDGSIKETIELPDVLDSNDVSYSEIKVSPSEQYIALECYLDFLKSAMVVYDTKTKKLLSPDQREEETHLHDFEWLENNTLCVSYGIDSDNQRQLGISLLSVDHATIKCFDPANDKTLWENEFSYTDVIVKDGFLELPKTDSVLYFASNKAEIYNRKTGEVLKTHNVNSNILCASDSDKDGTPVYITENGETLYPIRDSQDELYVINEMTADIDLADFHENVYVHKRYAHDIICYAYGLYDPDWREMDHSPVFDADLRRYLMDENILAILTEEDDKIVLSLYDTNTSAFLMQETLSDNTQSNVYSYQLLGSDDRKFYYLTTDIDSPCIYSVDLQSKAVSTVKEIETSLIFTNGYTFLDGKLYYVSKGTDSYEFITYDIANDKTESIAIDTDYYYSQENPIIFEDKRYAYITNSDGHNDYLVDLQNSTYIDIVKPEYYKATKNAAFDPINNLVTISNGNIVITMDMSGNEVCRLENMEIESQGLYVWTDNKKSLLLIPYNNGTLSFYDPNTLTETDSMEISAYVNSSNEVEKFQLDKERSILYMSSLTLTDVIDLENKYEVACVENCFGHHMGTDRFYNIFYRISSEKHIGYFRHYEINELIEKGRDMLGDAEMSESDKLKYGINDDE